jgi:hypothetical protein
MQRPFSPFHKHLLVANYTAGLKTYPHILFRFTNFNFNFLWRPLFSFFLGTFSLVGIEERRTYIAEGGPNWLNNRLYLGPIHGDFSKEIQMNYIPIFSLPYLVSEKRDQPSLNWRGTKSNVYDPTYVLMHSYKDYTNH